MSVAEKLLDEGATPETEYDPEDMEYWSPEAEQFSKPYYELAESLFKTKKDPDALSQELEEIYYSNLDKIDKEYPNDEENEENKKTRIALLELNYSLCITQHLLEHQEKINIRGGLVEQEIYDNLAMFQHYLIRTLLTFKNEEILNDGRKSVSAPEAVMGLISALSRNKYGTEKGDREANILLSGIYAPVYFTLTAQKAGAKVSLPKPEWDAAKGVDVILTNPKRLDPEGNPEVLMCQVKGRTLEEGSEPNITVFVDNNMDTKILTDKKEVESWNNLDVFCDTLARNKTLEISVPFCGC